MTSRASIREFEQADWPALWPMLRTTFEAGDTYSFAPESTEAEIRRAWIESPAATFVACAPDESIVGSYFIKANQPGLGAHVCNCGYVVAPAAQGQGIAAAMCEHSQQQAITMGFRAMQFNLVVSSNERAVRLWQRLGYSVVGALPGAFRHSRLGYVDALVMYKQLGAPDSSTQSERAVSSVPMAAPPVLLVGERIGLRELRPTDASALVAAAADGELWKLPFTVVPSAETVTDYIRAALDGRAAGTVIPFVIELLDSGKIIGSTRFWKIDRSNRKLEIGSTWIGASWQKSFVNTEAKLLMLTYAFEELRCVRVQFTTDETNAMSRAAIVRLGATQEGIVRNERIMPNGRRRNSVRFSIIDEEWPTVRRALSARLARNHDLYVNRP